MLEPGAGGVEVFSGIPGPMDEFWDPGSFFPGIPVRFSASYVPVGVPAYLNLSGTALGVGAELPPVPIYPETGAAGVADRPLTEEDALEAAREVVQEATEANGELEFPPGSIFAPGQIWGDRPPENWPDVYERYENAGGTEVAVDWGQVFGGAAQQVIQGWMGPSSPGGITGTGLVGGGAGGGMTVPGGPGYVPPKVTVDTRTGRVTVCRRRRRRALLTEGDFNDLMRIGTLPNTQNVRVALAKAVGR